MNPGPVEEVGQTARNIIDIMKEQPIALALVIMNVALLVLFWFILDRISDTTKSRELQMFEQQKHISELLSKCVVPSAASPTL